MSCPRAWVWSIAKLSLTFEPFCRTGFSPPWITKRKHSPLQIKCRRTNAFREGTPFCPEQSRSHSYLRIQGGTKEHTARKEDYVLEPPASGLIWSGHTPESPLSRRL